MNQNYDELDEPEVWCLDEPVYTHLYSINSTIKVKLDKKSALNSEYNHLHKIQCGALIQAHLPKHMHNTKLLR